jgi:hypothetical protein
MFNSIADFEAALVADQEDVAEAGQIVEVGGIPKRVTTPEELNQRFAILQAPGQPCCIVDRGGCIQLSEKELGLLISTEVVATGAGDKITYVAAAKYFIGNINRRVYRRIVFTSKMVPQDHYNIFKGLAIKPKAGCCDRIKFHIRSVICSDDDAAYHAMLNLIAWQLQNIGRASRIIVVLISEEQQVGKGFFLEQILLPIFGDLSGFKPSTSDQVTGKFNPGLVGCVYIFLDEVLFAGDRKSADAIKRIATETSMTMEKKFKDPLQVPTGVNLWLASNRNDAVYIDNTDVRHWILRVSEARKDDFDYFNILDTEIRAGGIEAFLHEMLQRDISAFIPQRDIPKQNIARTQMIIAGANPFAVEVWLELSCRMELVAGSESEFGVNKPWKPGEDIKLNSLFKAYQKWQQTVRTRRAPEPTNYRDFPAALRKWGFEGPRHTELGNFWVLPDPVVCLQANGMTVDEDH